MFKLSQKSKDSDSANLPYNTCHFLSQPLLKIDLSAEMTMPVLMMLLLLLRSLESPLSAPLATTLSGAPLPCQVEVCFVAQLEPTLLRWCLCDKC